MTRLRIGKHSFALPIELVTSTQAILARKRSGKSYTASVQAEELLQHSPNTLLIAGTTDKVHLEEELAAESVVLSEDFLSELNSLVVASVPLWHLRILNLDAFVHILSITRRDSMTERAALESWTDSQIIAPAWHTAGVLVLLLGLVVLSMHEGRGSHGEPSHRRMASYIVTMIAEWLIFAFIALGARWQGASMRTLVGAASLRWRLIARDLGLAVAFLIAANFTLGLLGYVLGRLKHPATSEALKNLLPHSRLEAAVFLLLALTAAICEEMIFRGYLQRQFTAWTKSATAGIVMQALAFGLAHAYQGSSEVILIAVYGGMFGVLAHWRGSLRPGIMAHFLQDGAGGLLAARSLLK